MGRSVWICALIDVERMAAPAQTPYGKEKNVNEENVCTSLYSSKYTTMYTTIVNRLGQDVKRRVWNFRWVASQASSVNAAPGTPPSLAAKAQARMPAKMPAIPCCRPYDLGGNEILQIVEAASLPPDVPLVRQGWRTYELPLQVTHDG